MNAKMEKFKSQAIKFGVDLSQDQEINDDEDVAKIIGDLLNEMIDMTISQLDPHSAIAINIPYIPTQTKID